MTVVGTFWNYDSVSKVLTISVKVKPNAKADVVVGIMEFEKFCALGISIASQPHQGKANERLIKFLSECLEIPKSSIKITSGLANKLKRVSISHERSESLIIKLKKLINND